MDIQHAKGKWIAWFCIVLGLIVVLYSIGRIVVGGGGTLALVVGLPVFIYGILMLRAVRKVKK